MYLFLEREGKGGKEGEEHQCVVDLVRPLLGTWPSTQACALTGNQTGELLVLRAALSPLSYTSQGLSQFKKNISLSYSHFLCPLKLCAWSKCLNCLSLTPALTIISQISDSAYPSWEWDCESNVVNQSKHSVRVKSSERTFGSKTVRPRFFFFLMKTLVLTAGIGSQ